MRSLNSKAALAIGVAAIAASGVWSGTGCSAKKPTEIVPGALTQVQVPRDLGAIKVTVLANGAQKFCRGYVVGPGGEVELPSTLGVVSGAPDTTLTVTLRGYDDANSPDVNDCEGNLAIDSDDPVNGPGPRILRQAVVSYVDQHTLFLPMPLSFSCYDADCSAEGAGSTCVAGECVASQIAASSLAEFTPDLVDGTGECFNPSQCFAVSAPAAVIDANNCVYGLPPGVPTTTGGLNVRIAYTDFTYGPDPETGLLVAQAGEPLEQEILSQDPKEGFTIPNLAQPTRFQLATGLCSLVHNATTPPQPTPAKYHSISNVEVAVGCPSKQPLLPFCAGQQTGNVSTSATPPVIACGLAVPLEPTPSALYLVMDDSGAMYGAFGAQGSATAMNLSLADPIFKHTYVAFRFLTHNPAECTPGSTTAYTTLGGDAGGVDFGLAPNVQPQVAKLLLDWQAPDTPSSPAALDLEAAMRLDDGAYQRLVQFEHRIGADAGVSSQLNTAAVMFFVNRTPTLPGSADDAGSGDAGTGGSEYPMTADDCPAPPLLGQPTVQFALSAEAQTAAAQGLQTYVIVLNNQQLDPSNQLKFYKGVAAGPGDAGAAEAGPTVTVLDGTSSLASVFESTLAGVATCLYDLPAGVNTTASLSFVVPPGNPINTGSTAIPVGVALSPSCKAATSTSVNGWNIDNGRIRLCGTACQQLQQTIAAVAAGALGATGDAGSDGGATTTADAGADGGVPLPVIPDVPVTVTMPCVDGGS